MPSSDPPVTAEPAAASAEEPPEESAVKQAERHFEALLQQLSEEPAARSVAEWAEPPAEQLPKHAAENPAGQPAEQFVPNAVEQPAETVTGTPAAHADESLSMPTIAEPVAAAAVEPSIETSAEQVAVKATAPAVLKAVEPPPANAAQQSDVPAAKSFEQHTAARPAGLTAENSAEPVSDRKVLPATPLRVCFWGKHPTFDDHINSAGHRDLPLDAELHWLMEPLSKAFRDVDSRREVARSDFFICWRHGARRAVVAAWASEDRRDRRRARFFAAMTLPVELLDQVSFALPRLNAFAGVQRSIASEEGGHALRVAVEAEVEQWHLDAADAQSYVSTRSSGELIDGIENNPAFASVEARNELKSRFPQTQGLGRRIGERLGRFAEHLKTHGSMPAMVKQMLSSVEPPEADHLRLPACADNAPDALQRWLAFAEAQSPAQSELLIAASQPANWVDIFFGWPTESQMREMFIPGDPLELTAATPSLPTMSIPDAVPLAEAPPTTSELMRAKTVPCAIQRSEDSAVNSEKIEAPHTQNAAESPVPPVVTEAPPSSNDAP